MLVLLPKPVTYARRWVKAVDSWTRYQGVGMVLASIVLTNSHSLKIKSWKGWNKIALKHANVSENKNRPALKKQVATGAWYSSGSGQGDSLPVRRNPVLVPPYWHSVFLPFLRLCFFACKPCVCDRHAQISRCQNSSHVALSSLRRLFRTFVLPQPFDFLLA